MSKPAIFDFLLAKIVQLLLLRDELAGFDVHLFSTLAIVTVLCIGTLLVGVRIRDNISVQLFKRIVLAMLFVLSLRALWQAIVPG